MNAEQYLDRALSGNMNIGTLKLLAWLEIIEGYARLKVEEALKPPHNSNYAAALVVWEEFWNCKNGIPDGMFGKWCVDRLNADKQHCA